MHTVYLHTGSNLGKRRKNLTLANMLINEMIGKIVQQSSIYETAPWGKTDQPDFLNQALEVHTELSPAAILDRIRVVENQIGRNRGIRWGSRKIDIDILFYDDMVMDSDDLQIPHARLHLRNFVLRPLAEIAPDFLHPQLDKRIKELEEACEDPLTVNPVQDE